MQTSPISSVVRGKGTTKEIGDVCKQARERREFRRKRKKAIRYIKKQTKSTITKKKNYTEKKRREKEKQVLPGIELGTFYTPAVSLPLLTWGHNKNNTIIFYLKPKEDYVVFP